jgi:hypothetical protein
MPIVVNDMVLVAAGDFVAYVRQRSQMGGMLFLRAVRVLAMEAAIAMIDDLVFARIPAFN